MEGGEEVVGGGGEEDEVVGDGDGLDGEVAREEGRVVEEEVVERWVWWWRREMVPRVGDRVKGVKLDGVGIGRRENGVEREEGREGR